MKNLKIKQLDSYDCGAACLNSIARWWGIYVPTSRIRRECGCTPEGISIMGISDGAKSIGLEAKGLKSQNPESIDNKIKNLNELKNVTTPFIAHTITEDGMLHFVVVYKVEKGKIIIMDPSIGDFINEKIEVFAKRWSGYIILITPNKNYKKIEKGEGKIRNLIKITRQFRYEFSLALIGSIIITLLGLSNSLILQFIIDKVIPNANIGGMFFLMVIIILLLPLSLFLDYGRNILLIRSGIKIDTHIILSFLRKVFKLPIATARDYKIGDIESRISDSYKIRSFVSEGMIQIIVSSLTLLFVATIMFVNHWKLALCTIAFTPMYIVLYYFANKVSKKYKREVAKKSASFESDVIDSLESFESVKHYMNGESACLYTGSYSRLMETIYTSSKLTLKYSLANNGISQLFLYMIIIVGGVFIIKGGMSIGQMVAFYTLSSYFIIPMNELIRFNSIKNEAFVGAERILDIMELDEEGCEGEDKKGNLLIDSNVQCITLENIGYRYKGREQLFEGISGRLNKGEICAICGKNGSGKSTLGKLILKDLDVQQGEIRIDQTNLRNIEHQGWRKIIGIATGQGQLFSATFIDNITSFSPSPNMERLIEICVAVGLDNLIQNLPKGLNTHIGSRGENLSGGEKQKIAIARMLYHNPAIYIFDEATSYMDKESEERILKLMNSLKQKGKIVIMISHKSENIKLADKVINIG